MTKSAFNKTHKPAKINLAGGDESDQFQTPWHALPMVEKSVGLPLNKMYIWEPACGKGNIVNYYNWQMPGPMEPNCWGSDYLAGEAYNFFTTKVHQTRRWDCIITNPPWSLKIPWTIKCLELGKPFALLVPITYMEGAGTKLIDQNKMSIIMPYQRIAYETPHEGWYSHYGKMPGGESCRYKDPYSFVICPKCGRSDSIRQIKSSPQKKSMWITWGFNLGQRIVYYDMKGDMLKFDQRRAGNTKRSSPGPDSGHPELGSVQMEISGLRKDTQGLPDSSS